jgi:glycolate oxidase FAD binding subunit
MQESIAPASVEELAEAIRAASSAGRPVVPWGAGSLQHLGAAPAPEALLLRTTKLNRILEYNPADLTITIEGGAALGVVQDALRPHGQWLPWDPPAPREATIGGLLATGASGPLRLGYGTPRDWVLGMRVALGDGRLVKSGGKVVKNVAGYESHKLHIGALGTLGVIAEATLKVAPLPERIETRVLACGSAAGTLALAERLRERPLAPASLVILASGTAGEHRLAARFAGAAAAVARQLRAAEAAAKTAGATVVALGDEEAAVLWHELAAFAMPAAPTPDTNGSDPAGAVVIRAGAPPSALGEVLAAVRAHAPAGSDVQLVGYAGVGLAYARWMSTAGQFGVPAALAGLRAALAEWGGYAVVEYVPAELRPSLDLWGAPPPTLGLMRALKAQWDPRGILNRGRYVGGL